MFVRTFHKAALRRHAAGLWLGFMTVLLFTYPQALATGISRGLSVCSHVLIPTLYPFMLLAGWTADSPLCRQPGKLSRRLTARLFHLPGCCGPVIAVSLIGGYPAGALAIARLLEQGRITKEQARRLVLFCVNAGPGFIVATVGGGLLGSVKAGALLCIGHITAAIILGMVSGIGQTPDDSCSHAPAEPPRTAAKLITDTGRALLTMCAFVLPAAAILSLSEALHLPGRLGSLLHVPAAGVSAFLAAFTEVSCGSIALAHAGAGMPLFMSLCLSWGGLAVHGQLAAILPAGLLSYPRFILFRLYHGLLAGGLSLLLFHCIPVTVHTAAPGKPLLLPFEVSVGASVMLLLLSFFAMLCFSEKRTGKRL